MDNVQKFAISLISNSPRAVSISDGISSGHAALPFFSHLFEGLLNFLLKNLGAFVIRPIMGGIETALELIRVRCHSHKKGMEFDKKKKKKKKKKNVKSWSLSLCSTVFSFRIQS